MATREKTVVFTQPWTEPDFGIKYEPGQLATVTEPLALDLLDKGIAREHAQPGPTETKVVEPTETK